MRRTPVFLVLLLMACGQQTVDRSQLSVPEPETTQLEPSLAEWLLGVHDDVGSKLTDPETSREELATRIGDYAQVLHAFDLREAAIEAYGQAARLDPQDFRWPYLSGRLREFLGDLEGAEGSFVVALEIDPDAAHAWVRLGDVQRARGDTKAAAASYRRALDLEPLAAAHFGLGQVQLAEEDAVAAVDSFRSALELQPAASAVYAPLAQALRSLGSAEQAEEALARRGRHAVELNDPTEDALGDVRILGAYQALLSMAAGEDLTADELLGFTLTQLGDVTGSDEAIAKDLAAMEREDRAETRRQRARLHYALGGLHVYLERDEEAEDNFLRTLELAPDLAAADLKLGNLMARRGSYSRAVEAYDQVLSTEPDHVEALVKRGTALLNLRQPKRARRDFERALSLDPGDALARVRLAEVDEVAGNLTAAERSLRQALDGDVELDARGRALIHRGLGDFLVRRQRFEEAAEALSAALEEDRTLVSARLRLADVLAHQGRFEEAIQHYDRVVASQPSNVVAHLHRTGALLLTGKWEQAIDVLEVANDLNPDQPLLQHQLARLLAANPERRDGDRALELVAAIHDRAPTAESAVTMGMALAALGRFDDAIAIESTVPTSIFHDRRMRSYRSGRPYVATDARELLVLPPSQ